MDADKVVVSIWCLTYNHKDYIKDALDGFLLQNTNFKYEIVIHDDASTDGTMDILKDYEAQYPDLIRVIYEEENQYCKTDIVNFFYQLERQQLKGKYIALCEGDDCWVDSHKLQLQVDYLESHPDCMLVVHNAILLDCRNNTVKIMNSHEKECDLQAKDIIVNEKGIIPTSSMMYRKNTLMMDQFFLQAGVGDYTRELFFFSKGKVHYFNRVMSVYRFLHSGSWQEEQAQDFGKYFKQCIKLINFLDLYNNYTKGKYESYIVSKKQYFIDDLIHRCSREQIEENQLECKNEEYIKYFSSIKRFLKQRYDVDFCDNKVKKFAEENKYIVIMGIGKYGKILAQQLEANSIKYEGFIVSDDQVIQDEFEKKIVWHIKDIPFEKEQLGVLIGIDPIIWYKIEEIMKIAKIKNYLCPFIL